MKLNDWLNIWLNKYVKMSAKLRTYNIYKETIEKHINPVLGEYELEELTPDILQSFVLEKKEKGNLITGGKLANNTVIGMTNLLKQAIKDAILLGNSSLGAMPYVKLPTPNEKEVTAFEKCEQEKLEKFCLNSKKKNYVGIVICLYTGIRLGELLSLTWNDVDFDKKYLYINKTSYTAKKEDKYTIIIDTPKTKSSTRIIPLPKQIVGILKRMKKSSKSNYIISTNKSKIVGTRSYQRTFEMIQKKLRIPYKNFHSLRHTFATRAIEMGMDVKTLSEILGHKNPVVTLTRYTHSMMSYKTDMMNKMGKMLAV